MAVMLYRYAQYKGYDVNKQVSLSEFPDAEKVSGYAQQAMQWCVAEKMIQGDNGNLNPGNNANRAECSAIISRFANLRLWDVRARGAEQSTFIYGDVCVSRYARFDI